MITYYLPSSLFVVVSWASFLIPSDDIQVDGVCLCRQAKHLPPIITVHCNELQSELVLV